MLMTPKNPAEAMARDPRWAAIVARDPAQDGRFVYAVRTTGIYCRPVCPARRPAPANVVFYAGADQAEAAGFRACRRCDPARAGRDARQAERIAAACRTIEAAEEPPLLADLAREAGLGPHHFHRMFRAATGLTPRAYAAAARERRVRAALAEPRTSITAAIYDAGYSAPSRFYENAKGRLGMTPTRLRRGGANETLRFAIGQSSLGAVLVAASAAGVAAILIGDDPEGLARDLQDRFPHADLIAGDEGFGKMVAAVIAMVEEPHKGLGLPLDIRGTAFQERVWQALMKVGPGETVSYAELARRLGAPSATRAVAGACAANPLAIVVPCHRVVRSDGGLSGYRWGVERKRALLDRESTPPDEGNPARPAKPSAG